MDYVEVTYVVKPLQPYSEILISRLAEAGFDSFEETDTGFKAYVEGKSFSDNILQNIELFEDEENVEVSYSVKKIDNTNWNQVWESNFTPVLIDDCYIRAPFHEKKEGCKYELLIEPKMSFGTGHHETTSLMVRWLLEIDFKGKKVLDMGCGTGVLAILAEKRGAIDVMAIDNYIYAYENTIENIERNNCKNIKAVLGDATALGDEEYDVVIANITKNILIEDMHAYDKVLKKDGFLLLSGFFADDKQQLLDRAKDFGLKYSGEKTEKEWMSLCLKK